MLRRDVFRTLAAAFVTGGTQLLGAGTAYQTAIAEWRKNYDRDLRSPSGPLYLIGRYNLVEGKTGIGSEASSAGIRLPDRAPKRVGSIERRGDLVTFVPSAGIPVKLNGKPMGGPTQLRTVAGSTPRDRVEFGDFKITVSNLEGACQLAVSDRQSQYLKEFSGSLWFPVNVDYRVQAAFIPYPQPKELKIPDTTGRARPMVAPGYVTFRLKGERLRLEPVITVNDGANELFFMFKDRTSGRETYGAGRFLEAEMPKNDEVLLDFNKAYNPYCAFNPYSSCPIPPKQNTLMVGIEAGEKYRGEH